MVLSKTSEPLTLDYSRKFEMALFAGATSFALKSDLSFLESSVYRYNDYEKEIATKIKRFDVRNLSPFVPSRFLYNRKGLARERSFIERVHVMLTDPDQSRLGMAIATFTMAVIFLSCTSFVIETLPSFQIYSAECEKCKPLRGDDYVNQTLQAARHALADQCHGCEPTTSEAFTTVETFSIAVFTTEYLLKFFTAHAAISAHELQKSKVTFQEFKTYRGLKRTLLFMSNPMTIIDLVAIIPYYIGLMSNGFGAELAVVRVIRLFRVFRVLRMGTLANGMKLFSAVISASMSSFVVFWIFSAFAMIIFASLVYYAEKGHWDPATGEYYRPSIYYLDPETPSPYSSIPDTFWWVVVTFCTVGYGDMVPTTKVGKLLGTITMYSGVLLISMPITIMGVNLSDLYVVDQRNQARQRRVESTAALILHEIFLGHHHRPLRKALNSWRAYVREQKEEEEIPAAIIRKQFREFFTLYPHVKLSTSAMKLPPSSSIEMKVLNQVQQPAHMDELLTIVRKELTLARAELKVAIDAKLEQVLQRNTANRRASLS
eukprot:c6594_g1_i2.p1 GENE.c6594_g1_i2~~c6594_g1_i2.p1  ORF type:complete len:545 (+),score=76.66 c6594_g1_i2:903-2537(+)